MAVYGNRWEEVRNLSSGGQGLTIVVRDLTGTEPGESVLKRLKNVESPERLARFKTEVGILEGLRHPNVLSYIDADLDAAKPWFVTEYCTGGDLARAQPFWLGQTSSALSVFLEICEGVAAAHRQGVVHRDIKPANIFLREPGHTAVVGDFGIAFVEGIDRQTATSEVVGAWFFMAPEMEDGRVDLVSPRSDVYSLGKILYWLLAGKIFNREKHRHPAWNLINVCGDPRLEAINRLLDGMLVADPANRLYNDADEMLADTRAVARVLAGPYNVVSPNLPQRCQYCGLGTYVLKVPPANIQEIFGARPVQGMYLPIGDWRVLICDQCGHLQLFRIESAARRDSWWKDSQ